MYKQELLYRCGILNGWNELNSYIVDGYTNECARRMKVTDIFMNGCKTGGEYLYIVLI